MTMSIFDDEFIQKAHDNRIRQEGRDAARHEVAQRMIENGLSDDMITSITGLSVDEVNALKASMTLSGSKV